jgi:hypothetical protein
MRVLLRILVLGVFLFSATADAQTPHDDGDPSLDTAIDQLDEGQRLHIRKTNYGMLRGRFVRAAGDSIYMSPRPVEESVPVGVWRDEVDVMWTVGPHGVGRGLLWAGGTLATVVALAYAGSGTEEELVFLIYAGAIAVPIAFVVGAMGDKETMIYSRERDER